MEGRLSFLGCLSMVHKLTGRACLIHGVKISLLNTHPSQPSVSIGLIPCPLEILAWLRKGSLSHDLSTDWCRWLILITETSAISVLNHVQIDDYQSGVLGISYILLSCTFHPSPISRIPNPPTQSVILILTSPL